MNQRSAEFKRLYIASGWRQIRVAQELGLNPSSVSLAIGVLNIVAGWTLLGWVVALVWACTRTGKQT